jgi:hypothetical protein
MKAGWYLPFLVLILGYPFPSGWLLQVFVYGKRGVDGDFLMAKISLLLGPNDYLFLPCPPCLLVYHLNARI